MVNKIIIILSTTFLSILLGIIAFFAKGTYNQLENVSSQMTGHLIAHGKADIKFELMESLVSDVAWNQYLLCKYAELEWPSHEKCMRQKKGR